MRYWLFSLFALTSFISLPGCSSSVSPLDELKVKMDSWLGLTEAQLIAQTGPPNFIRDDAQGGKVLIYGQAGNFCRMFYVNSAGSIYSWRFAIF